MLASRIALEIKHFKMLCLEARAHLLEARAHLLIFNKQADLKVKTYNNKWFYNLAKNIPTLKSRQRKRT